MWEHWTDSKFTVEYQTSHATVLKRDVNYTELNLLPLAMASQAVTVKSMLSFASTGDPSLSLFDTLY